MPLAVNYPKANGVADVVRATFVAAPLAVAPGLVLVISDDWSDWQRMVAVAVAVFAAAKWLSLADFWGQPPANVASSAANRARRIAGYLFLWPGMDPRPFFANLATTPRPSDIEWFLATGKTLLGVIVLAAAAPLVTSAPFAAGWLGIAGFLLVFHFGLFHVLSLGWRAAGVHAVPIMNAPLVAASLADFWGRRWNLAFRDLAHRFVFRPVVGTFGSAVAALLVFVVSGSAHEAVVSLPVRGGYGGPAAYFVIQGLAMLVERRPLARRLGLGRGLVGWAFTQLVVLGPVGLLFHRHFIERAIIPLLATLLP